MALNSRLLVDRRGEILDTLTQPDLLSYPVLFDGFLDPSDTVRILQGTI